MVEIADYACNRSVNVTGCEEADGATILSPIVMFLAGLLGNVLALVVLYRTKNQSIFYTLVAGLAWTDLIGILLTSPITILNYINGRQWVGGQPSCNFNGFVMICFGLATPFIVCAMAVERLLAIRCRYFYSIKCNINSARALIVLLWISVLMFGIVPLFGFGRYSIQYPGTWCFLDFHSGDTLIDSYGYIYACLNLAIVVVMVLCNGYVMISLFKVRYLKKTKYAQDECSDSNTENEVVNSGCKRKKQGKLELQMIVLMCVITTIFAMCWAPLMIQIIFTITTGVPHFVLDLAAIRLASLNQTLDPWLYILLRRSFLQKISRTFKQIFCTNKDDEAIQEASPLQTWRTGQQRRVVCNNSFRRTILKYFDNAHFSNNCDRQQPQRLQSGNAGQSLPDVTKDTSPKAENELPDVAERTLSCPYCRMKGRNVECSTCSSNSSIAEGIYVTIVLPQPQNITIVRRNSNETSCVKDDDPLAGSGDRLLCSSDPNSFDPGP